VTSEDGKPLELGRSALNGIPQPLVVLLEVLLAKNPVGRFQTPAELLKVMPAVRDAINAGRAMMKTIRVFVSSTGDVQKERHLAERVMRAIAAEFNLPVNESYSVFQALPPRHVLCTLL